MLRYLRLKLVEMVDKNYKCPEDFSTGVIEYPLESSYTITGLVKVQVEAGKKYMVLKLLMKI
jgi:hypothetical protein